MAASRRAQVWALPLASALSLAWAAVAALVPAVSGGGACPPPAGVWRAACAIVDASAEVAGVACAPLAGQARHRCGPEPWQWVGRVGAAVGGGAIDGVWLHPAPGAKVTTLRWDDLPLGARVEGVVGLAPGSGAGAPVVVRLQLDGQDLHMVEVDDELDAVRFALPLPPGPPRGSLRLLVSARDDARRMAVATLELHGARESAP